MIPGTLIIDLTTYLKEHLYVLCCFLAVAAYCAFFIFILFILFIFYIYLFV